MPPMLLEDLSFHRRAPLWAIAVSVLIHGLVLLIPRSEPSGEKSRPRLEASLAPRQTAQAREVPVTQLQARKAERKPGGPRLLTTQKPGARTISPSPKWSVAERAEMNRFLDELDSEAKAAPRPSLAQRSLAMAREQAREMARQDEAGTATLELRPNAAPPDPFSLEMYVDGLIRRLNRSSAFVRNDPRSKGVRPAAVQFRLNPDGTLKSFSVLNAGDQAAEIAFIKTVVERSIPFAPFPADLDKSARSLAMTICILPTSSGDGFGFSRMSGGRGC